MNKIDEILKNLPEGMREEFIDRMLSKAPPEVRELANYAENMMKRFNKMDDSVLKAISVADGKLSSELFIILCILAAEVATLKENNRKMMNLISDKL